MFRVIKVVITSVLAIVALLLVLPYVVNWQSYSPVILKSFGQLTDQHVEIGRVDGRFLPMPRFILSKVSVANIKGSSNDLMLSNATIEAQFSVLDFIRKKASLNKLTIKNAKIVVEILPGGNNIAFLFDRHQDSSVRSLSIENSQLSVIKNSQVLINNLKKLDLDIQCGDQEMSFVGDFPSKNELIKFDFKVHKKEHYQIDGQVLSASMKAIFSGNYVMHQDDWNITGTTSLDISNLSKVIDDIGQDNPLLYKIKSTEAMTAKGDIAISPSEVSVNNLMINSRSISASGSLKEVFLSNPSLEVELQVTNLDLDSLGTKVYDTKMSNAEIVEKEALSKLIYDSQIKKHMTFDIADNINVSLVLDVTGGKLYNHQFGRLSVKAKSHDGIIELYPSSLLLTSDAALKFRGAISSNAYRPIFQGEVQLGGKNFAALLSWLRGDSLMDHSKDIDFDINANVTVTPKEISLYNLNSQMDDVDFRGLVSLRLIKDRPALDIELDFAALNLDKYGTDSYISWLETYWQAGTDIDTKLQWLRALPYEINWGTTIKNLTFNKHQIDEISWSCYLTPGIMNVTHFNVDSTDENLSANASLDIRALKPKIVVDIKGDKLSYTKDVDSVASTIHPGFKWSSDPVNIIDLGQFDGNINAELQHLQYGKLSADNVSIQTLLSDGQVHITNLESDIYGGKIIGTGTLIALPLHMQGSFSLTNVMAEKLLPDLLGLPDISGYMSLSGSLDIQGNTPLKLASSLTANFSFAGRQVKVGGVNFDQIMHLAQAQNARNVENIDRDIIQAINSGHTTFNNIDGQFNFNSGIMTTNSFVYNTDYIRGSLAGTVDAQSFLTAARTEFAFIPQVNAPTIHLNMTLEGPIDSLEKKIDASELKRYVQTIQ